MNKKNIIIFGINDLAKILYFFLKEMKEYNVCAFTLNREYMPKNKEFYGKPIIEFENLITQYPPNDHSIFICVGYNRMNECRKKLYYQLKDMGYNIENFIHKNANIYTTDIGEGNIILSGVTIDPYTKIGNCNIFFTDALFSHDSVIGDFNFLAVKSCVAGHVNIKNNCFLGAHSTIKNGVNIDSYTLVGANAYVNKDTTMYDVLVPEKSFLLNNKKSTEIII